MRSFNEQVAHYLNRPAIGVADRPVGGTAAWVSDELEPTQWRVALGADARADLEAAVAAVDEFDLDSFTPPEPDSVPALAAEVEAWTEALVDGLGFTLVSGFPVENWTIAQQEAACWLIGTLMGEPGGQNADGDLLGHVVDLAGDNHADERLYRTNKNIRFHCDAADVVGLLCLATSPAGGSSRVVSSVAVHDRLRAEDPEAAARLFEPMKLDSRRPPQARPRYTDVTPSAFDGDRLRTFMHLDYYSSIERFDDLELDPAARRMLDKWEAIAEDPSVHLEMDLEVGDLQLVNNHTVVHARTGYTDDPANPRHLLRLWLSLG